MDSGLAQRLAQGAQSRPDASIMDRLRNALGVGAVGAALKRTQDTENTAVNLFGQSPAVKRGPNNTLGHWGINNLPERMKEMGLE